MENIPVFDEVKSRNSQVSALRTYPKGKATPKGRQAVNQAIQNVGETMMSGEMPMVPKASDVVGMMPQAPLPFGILPTGRPKIGLEDFFPQLNPPLAALGQQERYKQDAY